MLMKLTPSLKYSQNSFLHFLRKVESQFLTLIKFFLKGLPVDQLNLFISRNYEINHIRFGEIHMWREILK